MFVALPLAAGVLLMAVQPAHAQGTAEAATPSPCTITSADLDAITAAAANGLLPELAARQALLVKTITCAKSDAQALQANLNALQVPADAVAIQSQLSGRLDDAVNYYNIELGKVGGVGIAGTKAIASEVLAWRSANYDPLVEQVNNFTLWNQNQELFTTGTARLRSIEGVVAFIEQAASNADLEKDLGNAQSLMQTASNENAAAETAFIQSAPPGQTLALIQQSLQSLSAAYQKFFDIATIVQTLLPAATQGGGQ